MSKERQARSAHRPFGIKLRELREKLGLSQEALAYEADYYAAKISLIELHRSGISIPKLLSLCKALKTDPNTILCWEEYEQIHRCNDGP